MPYEKLYATKKKKNNFVPPDTSSAFLFWISYKQFELEIVLWLFNTLKEEKTFVVQNLDDPCVNVA